MYLKARGIPVPGLDDPARPVVPEADLRAFVNREVFFFRDRKALRRFTRDPLGRCGILTDPVNGVRFRPMRTSPRLDHGGVPYFFSSDSTFALFRAMPDSFAVRRGM